MNTFHFFHSRLPRLKAEQRMQFQHLLFLHIRIALSSALKFDNTFEI